VPKLERVLHDRERSKEARAILNGLIRFNAAYGGREDWRELTIALKDNRGRVVAGLNGHSDWGWLFVKLLWVSDAYRGQGLGTRLMRMAEAEGRKRRCRAIWLDTFSFQAPKFYHRLGYRKFGELRDYPKGYKRYFLTKRI
jgi:ribosomal protein S18 acetylase RimI-like enzyme